MITLQKSIRMPSRSVMELITTVTILPMMPMKLSSIKLIFTSISIPMVLARHKTLIKHVFQIMSMLITLMIVMISMLQLIQRPRIFHMMALIKIATEKMVSLRLFIQIFSLPQPMLPQRCRLFAANITLSPFLETSRLI